MWASKAKLSQQCSRHLLRWPVPDSRRPIVMTACWPDFHSHILILHYGVYMPPHVRSPLPQSGLTWSGLTKTAHADPGRPEYGTSAQQLRQTELQSQEHVDTTCMALARHALVVTRGMRPLVQTCSTSSWPLHPAVRSSTSTWARPVHCRQLWPARPLHQLQRALCTASLPPGPAQLSQLRRAVTTCATCRPFASSCTPADHCVNVGRHPCCLAPCAASHYWPLQATASAWAAPPR
jgi:hypothetical protein